MLSCFLQLYVQRQTITYSTVHVGYTGHNCSLANQESRHIHPELYNCHLLHDSFSSIQLKERIMYDVSNTCKVHEK